MLEANALNWKDQVKRLLKAELVKNGVTHEELANLLAHVGVRETKAGIDSKISRGTFSAVFLWQCLYALKHQGNGTRDFQPVNISVPNFSAISFEENLFNKREDRLFIHNQQKVVYRDIRSEHSNPLNENKVVSLFSGAGGFDIGLEEAGFETAVCVEIDDDCRETLRHNRPRWKLFEDSINRAPGDIRSIQSEELLEFANLKKGEAALLIGGAPCQPFSNIGKKNGKSDPKNGDLFLEFVKMVKGIKPKAFIFENVAGITQRRHSDVIRYMKDKLEGMGYGISHIILNAANYGVPQRRERFFLLGISGVEKPAFPLPTHFKGLEEWNKFITELNPRPLYAPKQWITLKNVFSKLPHNYKNRKDYAVMCISPKVKKRMALIGPGENFKALPMDMRPACWKSGKHQGHDTFGRLRLDEPSVTIRTAAYNPAKGKYIHPTENRGLNTIEMATIQGFPYGWEFRCLGRKQITLVSAGRQVGNAVPPLLARALGMAIRPYLNKS